MVSQGGLRNRSGSRPRFLGPGGVRGLLGPSPAAPSGFRAGVSWHPAGSFPASAVVAVPNSGMRGVVLQGSSHFTGGRGQPAWLGGSALLAEPWLAASPAPVPAPGRVAKAPL